MRAGYVARVIIISPEMLVLLGCWVLTSHFETEATSIATGLNINQELAKYSVLLPISLFVWIAKEAKDLVFSNQSHAETLVNWPEYWALKVHIIVSLAYALVFCLLSAVPWLSKSGISDGPGLILFASGLTGILCVAASVYLAQMSIKEILTQK
jgi:hypothetical protein